MRSTCFDNDCDDLCNSLALKDLCAKKIRAKQGLFKELCAQQIKAESVCAKNLGVESVVAINNVCAQDVNTTTLCVTGTARINEVCGLYRASAQFANADTPYTLGDPVNFNQIIDDPNNDISLAPFYYTVPVTGYYIASVEIDVDNFSGISAILGTPVGNLQILVNGAERRQAYSPFLTFNNAQQTDLSFLLLLNAGDKLTVTYNMLVVGPTGTTPYVGTANIIGSGDNHTVFKIHYLSSTCTAGCQPCSAPVPCSTECTPLPNTCIHRP